jgi:S1-C subfamily serine protease
VITKIGSTAVTGSAQLGEVLASLQPGQKVQITYVRGNSTTATMVTLGTL